MAYLISTYNRFSKWDREHARYRFTLNDNTYAIMEVDLIWGQPQLATDTMATDNPNSYHLYETYTDALQFV